MALYKSIIITAMLWKKWSSKSHYLVKAFAIHIFTVSNDSVRNEGLIRLYGCTVQLVLQCLHMPWDLLLCGTASTVNVLKFRTPKCLTKWHMQTVQTQIRLLHRSSLIRVYTVCNSTKHFKNSCVKKQNLSQKALKKVLEIFGHLLYKYISMKTYSMKTYNTLFFYQQSFSR